MFKDSLIIIIVILLPVGATYAKPLMDVVTGQPKANEFQLSSVEGKDISLSDYKGKFVLLNFWATWCAPCRKEMPSMSNLHKQLMPHGFEVIGIHVGPSKAGVKKFLEAVPVDFTIVVDKDMKLVNWGVRGLPTTYLVNPEGKLIYQAIGEREWDSSEMIQFLKELIASYEHMAEDQTPVEKENKSFFANLIESLGWPTESNVSSDKLLPY